MINSLSNGSELQSILSPELAAAMQSRLTEPASGAPIETQPITPTSSEVYAPAPPEPRTLEETGLSAGLVESLLLKILLQGATVSGAGIADRSRLSRAVVTEQLARFRDDLLVTIKGQASGNDYLYQLTEAGHTRAKQHAEHANYADAAPVTLAAYDRAIRAQSVSHTRVTIDAIRNAFGEMTVSDEMVSLVAQAMSDGRGLFLYGSPGNGKTTIAERLCGAFGKLLWIPRAVAVGDDLLRVFDPSCHEEADIEGLANTRYDRRWVLIKRPTVVVGGELTLDQLEPCFHPASGVSEAPVQMKANGGALVIDDFGRQRASSTELLNRLIVPLEKGFDYLSLASGRQAQVPFDELFVLSTNLAPRELVDEAFLRRIPYKVEVTDPTLEQFHALFQDYASQIGVELAPGIVDELLKAEYQPQGRPMRFCHPRDLLRQAKNYCVVHGRPMVADRESLAAASHNYFAGL